MMDLSKLEETAPVRTQLGCRAADAARSGLKREDNLNSPTTASRRREYIGVVFEKHTCLLDLKIKISWQLEVRC